MVYRDVSICNLILNMLVLDVYEFSSRCRRYNFCHVYGSLVVDHQEVLVSGNWMLVSHQRIHCDAAKYLALNVDVVTVDLRDDVQGMGAL